MGLIEKLETFINKLLGQLGQLMTRLILKIIPPKLLAFFLRIQAMIAFAITWVKNLPKLMIRSFPGLLAKIKVLITGFDIKSKLKETHKLAMAQYTSQSSAKASQLKTLILTPFLMMGQWLKGLSTAQTLVLLSFSAASVLSGISMVFSGNRILAQHKQDGRTPASIEEEVGYERPAYYKKQARHFDITNLRLPVYFSNVGELRSIDVDFSTTVSNRLARMKLEKLEFQLRDHLILNVEPMVADFPLEEEGKEILRKKMIMEISDFMINNKIEGEVLDMKLTYILAN